MTDDDREFEEMEAWLADLRNASDDDFYAQVRPYFDDTRELLLTDFTGGRDVVEHVVRTRYKGRHRA